MTKKEMEVALLALLSKANAETTDAPAATAAATVPGWVKDAQSVKANGKANGKPVSESEPRTPRPLKSEILTVEPKPGQTFEPFRVLHIHNGCAGRFYRGHRLDERALAAVRAFKGSL